MDEKNEIPVNRAPVLTLWAAVVAERLGQDPEAAITLGRAVAGSSARVKARAIGIEENGHEKGDLRAAAGKPQHKSKPRVVHLLGRDVPVVEEKGKVRALDHDKAASPRAALTYVERAFGEDLPAVRAAMEHLARSLEPEELNRVGFRLYEHFRPEVEPGAKGWGARACRTWIRSVVPPTRTAVPSVGGTHGRDAPTGTLNARAVQRAAARVPCHAGEHAAAARLGQ